MFLFTNVAFSQEAQQPTPNEVPLENNVIRLPIMVDCGPKELIMPPITIKAMEQPFAVADTVFTTPTGQLLAGKGTIYVNADTKTWTLVVGFPDEASNVCYFLSGSNFGPASDYSSKTKIKIKN